jgi:hypothetical protein
VIMTKNAIASLRNVHLRPVRLGIADRLGAPNLCWRAEFSDFRGNPVIRIERKSRPFRARQRPAPRSARQEQLSTP